MPELFDQLCDGVRSSGREETVALLLSGGIDSASVGAALTASGRVVRAYTFEIKGYASADRARAEELARHFGWPLSVVRIVADDVPQDFVRLAVEHGCKTKVQFEVLYPLLTLLEVIQEKEVWSGWNADKHYGNHRRNIIEQLALKRAGASEFERQEVFDRVRTQRLEKAADDGSSDTWQFAIRLAAKFSKTLHDPYLADGVRSFFSRFSHELLASPSKPLVREELATIFRGLPANAFATGVRLQKGARIDRVFESLLDDPNVNRFETKYTSVSALCQRWGREVSAQPELYVAEAQRLPPRKCAAEVRAQTGYQPYTMEDVRRASGTKNFSVISTFAGGGGSSVGYRLAGGRVLAANEFVPEAANTYGANFPDCKVDRRDIRDINANDAALKLLAEVGLAPGELDILDGSPPCSEFSTAGNGITDDGRLKTYSDVKQRNIADLPFDFMRLAAVVRPKVVIMENVPALAGPRSRHVLDAVIEALRFVDGRESSQGYYAGWGTLFASDFGAPQKRQRLFIVGVRRDVGEATGFASDDSISAIYPEPTHTAVTIRSALDGLQQRPDDIYPWVKAAMTAPIGGWIRRLPKNPSKIIQPQHIDPTVKNNFTLRRCCWDRPAPTLVVYGQQPDGRTGALHPCFDRKFTIPELKRLTSLPDDFKLTGTLAQAAERICRMVPPLLTKALAESIHERVLRPYKEGQK